MENEIFEVKVVDGQVVGQRSVNIVEGDNAVVRLEASSGDTAGSLMSVDRDTFKSLALRKRPYFYKGKIIERDKFDEIQRDLSKMPGVEPDRNQS